jgi:RNA polymerase sigma-70 factor, ECF subfamily
MDCFKKTFETASMCRPETVLSGGTVDRETEKKLVEEARRDPAAFGALFEEYYPKILKYTVYRTGNAEIARDITSETFFKALKNLWKFHWIGSSFSSWLYKIAGNLVIDHFRAGKFEPLSLEAALEERKMPELSSTRGLEEEIMEAQERIDRNREYMEIKSALFKLPALYQEVLVLRFIDGHKIAEICEITGKKQGTIKSLISRGVSMLKRSMQPLRAPSVTKSEETETRLR